MDDIPAALADTNAYRVSQKEVEMARKLVAANSTDAEEAKMFLEELGLK